MRHWLLALAIPLGVLGCDSNGGDGDADVDAGPSCEDSGDTCDMSIPDCPEDQVCHDHRCVCARNREYEVQVVTAYIYERTPTGNCWDGEAPSCANADPYAVVCFHPEASGECAEENTFRTSTVFSDHSPHNDPSLQPIWNEGFTIFVGPSMYWGAWVYDDDSGEDDDAEDAVDDMILELEPIFPLTTENLRNAGLVVQTEGPTGTSLTLILAPK